MKEDINKGDKPVKIWNISEKLQNRGFDCSYSIMPNTVVAFDERYNDYTVFGEEEIKDGYPVKLATRFENKEEAIAWQTRYEEQLLEQEQEFAKPAKKQSKSNVTKILQKEIKAFNCKELTVIDYGDRLTFVGSLNGWLVSFFERRGYIVDRDREGFSLDKRDAKQLGLPNCDGKRYRLLPDARKKPIWC